MNNEYTTIINILSNWIKEAFLNAFRTENIDVEKIKVTASGNPEFGDYQCNDAMPLAKTLKKAPREIAQAVVDSAELPDFIEKLEIADPGFINIHLKNDWIIKYLEMMKDNPFAAAANSITPGTVILDYSSPNIAKPMHIGHIRSTIIGNSIDRIYRALNFNVIADNHIGDWGTQFGIIIMGYRHFLDKEALAENPVAELERIYVKSYEKSRTDDKWLQQCRMELVKLQQGDEENTALWKKFISLSMGEFDKIYSRLGVKFDLVRGESFYNDQLQDVIDLLIEKGLAKESEGALVVFLEEEKLPVCIVRKSDGGFNYATTDIATVINRCKEFNPDTIIYVTDERQQLHFKQFFTICKKLGYDVDLKHVWFGLMRLPEGVFSTRQGNVIKLESLLDEAERRALEIVEKSSPELPADTKREIARAVGIGAVKYADLSQNPQSTVTFTWEKALALDGNSGPYLQYAYARIASVSDKYKERFPENNIDSYPIIITENIERKLILKVIRFGETIIRAATSYKPSIIADYLYDLAQTYSTFYQTVPFLKAEEGIRESRIRLCGIIAAVLRSGLDLLGIETPDRI